jgi:hypothetical protein
MGALKLQKEIPGIAKVSDVCLFEDNWLANLSTAKIFLEKDGAGWLFIVTSKTVILGLIP